MPKTYLLNSAQHCNESFFIQRGLMTTILAELKPYSAEYSGILLCTKGYVVLEIEHEITTVEAMQILGNKPLISIHELEISPDCEVVILGIHNDLFPQLAENIRTLEPMQLLRLNAFSKISIQSSTYVYLEQLFELFELQLRQEESLFKFQKVKSIFMLIAYEIMQLFLEEHAQHISDLSRAKVITFNFYTLLNTNIHQTKGVAYFAEQLHITAKHLIASVKEITKETPRKTIDKMLLMKAKSLLKDNENSVQHVAELLGFSDASAFTKFFKRMSGESPKTFRNAQTNGSL